jgi:hypothetical protein
MASYIDNFNGGMEVQFVVVIRELYGIAQGVYLSSISMFPVDSLII